MHTLYSSLTISTIRAVYVSFLVQESSTLQAPWTTAAFTNFCTVRLSQGINKSNGWSGTNLLSCAIDTGVMDWYSLEWYQYKNTDPSLQKTGVSARFTSAVQRRLVAWVSFSSPNRSTNVKRKIRSVSGLENLWKMIRCFLVVILTVSVVGRPGDESSAVQGGHERE